MAADKTRTRRRFGRRIGRRMSVALKIGLPVVIITVLTTLVLGVASVNETKSRLNAAYLLETQGMAPMVVTEYQNHPNDREHMVGYLQGLLLTRGSLSVMRLNQEGFEGPPDIWASTRLEDEDVVPSPEELLPSRAPESIEISYQGVPYLETLVPMSLPNGVVSMGAFYTLADRNAALAEVRQRTLVAGTVALVLELLILFPTLYLLVGRRIKRLSRAAVAVADGDYDVRLPEADEPHSRDELVNVARQFDRMVKTVGARTRQQAAVASLGQKALEGGDVSDLLAAAAEAVAVNLGTEYTAILELTDERTLIVQAGHGWEGDILGTASVDIKNSQSGFTLETGEPVIMDDRENETRFVTSELQRSHDIRSGITVAIPGPERPYGVLAAHTTEEHRTFSKDDIGFMQSIANVLATGLERKKAEDHIAFMAHHDELTKLPNRAMFEELLDMSLARARRQDMAVAVLFLDVDKFKLVNDSLGHQAGDELLVQLSERLREAVRDTDVVARQGGDEFLVLLADIETESETPLPAGTDNVSLVAESVAVRIHQGLEQPFMLAGEEYFASSSIGISMFPRDADDATGLLKNSDAAMYRAKKSVLGGYVVYSTEASDPLNKLSLTTRLRKAVEAQNWVLHYQPIVELDTAEMVGVEALLRWQDPNGGIIPPGEFIPLAEEMGLIVAIGDWVMGEICRQSRAWRDQGLDLKISFNLSPRQLWQPEMVEKVLGHLMTAEVNPSQVVVEITESSAMTDPERTQRILWDLHARGVRLAIDDFGTGYSSLSRLKHMPVHTLKIDRSFVMDIPEDNDAGNMVQAVIQLAHSLGMSPLAEGIETQEQWDFLRDKRCQYGQGYFFSRPVPADEILKRFKENGLKLL